MKVVKNDVVGKKFGSLTVLDSFIQIGETPNRRTKWLCRCDCGNEFYVSREALLRRKIDYCEQCRKPGVRNEKLYHIYHGIKQRCYNPNEPSFVYYGAKGIKMCDEWLNGGYEVFKKWSMENGYEEGLSIDRLDSNKDYHPDNCEWVTIAENSRRGDLGVVKNHTKLDYIYALAPSGEIIDIDNIAKFSRDHGLNNSCVNAAIRGRMNNVYAGYTFHSSIIDS